MIDFLNIDVEGNELNVLKSLNFSRYKPKLIHANNVMSGRVAIIFKFIFKIPILIHLRNNKLPPRTIPFIKNADYFATVSESTMKEALPSYLYKKVKVVYDGINIQEFKNYKINHNIIILEYYDITRLSYVSRTLNQTPLGRKNKIAGLTSKGVYLP